MSPSPGSHDGPANGNPSHRVSVSSTTSGPHPPVGDSGGSKPGSVHRDGGGAQPQGIPRESAMAALLTATNRISRVLRTPAPAPPPLQPDAGREGSPDRPESPPVAPAEVTTTEHIEPAAPGSTLGGPHRDDSLDLVVGQVPPLDLDASRVGAGGHGPEQALADYSAAAERWLLTEANLEQYEEFMARGLLMVRNLARCDGRHVVQSPYGWVGLVRDCLAARQPLVRAAAANCVAALATSGPGRDAIQKDALIVTRTVQMLQNGLASGGDNSDTQYATLALANMSLVAGLRQLLLRQGALGAAAEVLRVAGRWFGPQQQAPAQPPTPAGGGLSHSGAAPGVGSAAAMPLAVPAAADRYPRGTDSSGIMATSPGGGMLGSSGHGNGGANAAAHAAGRKAVQRAAVYTTTLLTCIAVDNSGRDQMQMAGIPRLAAELHERCAAGAGGPGGLGPDSLLSRRLALLAEATTTAELLEDLLEAGAGGSSGAGWDAVEESYTGMNARMSRCSTLGHGGANALSRGVSFAEAGAKVTRAAAALNALQRLVDPETARKEGGGGALSSHQTMQRALSRKQSMAASALDTPLSPPGASVTFSGATSSPRAFFADVGSLSRRALITPTPPGLAISAGHLGSFAGPQPPSPTPPMAGNLGALLRNELGGGSLTSQPRSGSESGVASGMLGVHFSAAVFNDGQGGVVANNGSGVGTDDVSSPFRRSHTTHLANPATGGTGSPKSAVKLPHVVGFGSSVPRSNNSTSNGDGAGHTTTSHHHGHGHGQLHPHPPPLSPALMSAGIGPGSPMRPVPPNGLPPSSHSHHGGMHVDDLAGSPPVGSPASMTTSPHGGGSGMMMMAPSPPSRPRSSAAVSVASVRGGSGASVSELSRRMTNTKLNGYEFGSGSASNAAVAAAALGSGGGGLSSGGGALVPTGTRSGCNSPLPLSRQHSQARLELPFHLVRATTPSSTGPGGKMSRITAAYGSVGSRAGSGTGMTGGGATGSGAASGFSRMYTSEL